MRENPCKTPEGAVGRPEYDWRTEPWVKDASMGATLAGMRISAALQADGDGNQDTEDNKVLVLTTPPLADAVARGPLAGDHIRYRLAHAIAMCIDQAFRDAPPAPAAPAGREGA